MRYLYNVLFYLTLPWLFLRLLWRSRKNSAYRQRWRERLGYVSPKSEHCIWVHAASVGETLAAVPLIKALQAQYPDLPVLVTNMTVTGSARTKAAFGDQVINSYVPYDAPHIMARFIKLSKPVVAIIMETELWPNLFATCGKNNIPVIVANARLSAKSFAGYQRIAGMTRDMLTHVATMAVQTQVEADRFIELGLQPSKAIVTGNIKFDIEVPADLAEKSKWLREQLGSNRLIWVAASTHATEEEIILAAHQRILEKFPQALLILAPRHPERFNDVFTLTQQSGFNVARRSQQDTCTAATQVYLGDTMGELLKMYAVSDVAFVGGSFVQVGGHNMLEAAVLGKPVITGPQLYNFAEISRSLQAAQGMVVVQNTDELVEVVLRLLGDENYRAMVGESARRFVAANRGALAKQLQYTKVLIDEKLQLAY
ncbi:MAG: lipid IV(A) 3-deoxy-D-manno-octulosonic acid transferase [Pseudomonadota bacterium]